MLGCIGILEKICNIYKELKHLSIVLKIPYKKLALIKLIFLLNPTSYPTPQSWVAWPKIHVLKKLI